MERQKNAIRLRINQHLSSIRLSLDLPVAQHFNSTPHSVDDDFRFAPFDQESNDKYRKHKEALFINKFDTQAPKGLNLRTGKTGRHNAPFGRSLLE